MAAQFVHKRLYDVDRYLVYLVVVVAELGIVALYYKVCGETFFVPYNLYLGVLNG